MKKRFVSKKHRFKKFAFYIILILFAFLLSLFFNNKDKKEDILNNLMTYIKKENNLVTNIKNNIFDSKKIVFSSANKSVDYSNIANLNKYDLKYDYDNSLSSFILDESNKTNSNDILVYIYNTHQLEEYEINQNNEYSITPNVMLASYMLKDKLSNYNINALVETHSIKKYLDKYDMSYLESYDASRYYIEQTLKENKKIKFIIDLHRDALEYEYSYVKYNGKRYAKIMFVIGLGNRNYASNLKLAKRLNKKFEAMVPGITRTITKYPGDETNAVYNQDEHKNAILIEVGGHESKINEVNNTLDVFASILNEEINGNEKKEK